MAVAHTLENTGGIGGILHIDPDDDPIVREPAILHFALSDEHNLFNAQQCVCTLIVSRGDESLGSFPMVAPAIDQLELTYTFPQPGVYTLKLSGAPQQGGVFEPFYLDYDLRVSRTEAAAGTDVKKFLLTHGLHVILFGGAFIVVFALHVRNVYHQKRKIIK